MVRTIALIRILNKLTNSREQTAFINPARTDGLVLRHWRKKKNIVATTPGAPNTPAELKTEHDSDSRSAQTEPDYHFAKFNIKVSGPEYSNEQYEAHLKSDDWTKEETDYLIHLASEFDLRWIVIADRYDYQAKEVPSEGDSMVVTVTLKPRTMEDLKSRYYDVAAKVMVLHHPLSSMSTAEFDLHEKMIKFDPTQETTRKKLAEALLSRSPEEIREEEILLGELKRIVVSEERFALERKELYDRLQAPQSTASIQNYESSQGLANLMQTLLSVDKNKKQRRTLTGPGDGASSPATGGSGQNVAGPGGRDQRNSIGGSAIKKGSLSGSSSQRQLTPREEAKYGVSHHERLTSGVALRGYRIDKLLQAKSQAQSKKLDDALRELEVPHKAVMPTTKVCDAYELLVQKINILLEVRKVSEKIENEIKVQQAQKEYREKKESGEEAATPQGSSPAAEPDGDAELEQEVRREAEEEDDDDEDADGEAEDAEEIVEAQARESDEDGDGDGDNDGEDDGDADVDEENGLEEEPEEAGDESDNNRSADEDEDEDDGDGDDDIAEEDEADDSRLSAAPSNKSGLAHKRSASELSAASEKSSKRQKK